jgi:hypothetical protein
MTNVGMIDRVLRIIIGAALLVMAYMYWGTTLGYVGLIGIVPLLTAFAGICPLYSILGVRTCARQ